MAGNTSYIPSFVGSALPSSIFGCIPDQLISLGQACSVADALPCANSTSLDAACCTSFLSYGSSLQSCLLKNAPSCLNTADATSYIASLTSSLGPGQCASLLTSSLSSGMSTSMSTSTTTSVSSTMAMTTATATSSQSAATKTSSSVTSSASASGNAGERVVVGWKVITVFVAVAAVGLQL